MKRAKQNLPDLLKPGEDRLPEDDAGPREFSVRNPGHGSGTEHSEPERQNGEARLKAELQEANRQIKEQKRELERLRARKDLRAVNELLEKVFSNINVGIAYMDSGFNFIRVNRAYAEAEGCEPEFFAGKNHFALYPDSGNEDVFRRVVETGEPYLVYGKPFRYFKSYRRSSEYWDLSLNPIREADGTVSGLVLSVINVTNRYRAIHALRESEKKFRKLSQEFNILLDAIPDVILLLSPEMRVLWANRGAASVFGREIYDIAGYFCYELWKRGTVPCEKCSAVKCFRTGKEEGAQIPTADGRLWDSRAFPIKDENGRISNVIMISSDITEKMMLQAEVMRSDHLASLGKLAAGVAHEINNPINGIINYAQMLANRSRKEGRDCDIAERIIKESDRIAGIVRSLLSFARDRKEEKRPVPISEILSDALALTEAQMRKDCISLRVEIPHSLSEVIANPQQVQQVFLNIIDNARHALNRKYEGRHEDKVFEISGEEIAAARDHDASPYVRITFYDRGIGISPDILDKVVNPFFSTRPTGTGLGLSISHGIISDHGGKLLIESTEGEFTRVIVDLPAKRGRKSNEEDPGDR